MAETGPEPRTSMTQRYSSKLLTSTLLAFIIVAPHPSYAGVILYRGGVMVNRRVPFREFLKENGRDTTANYVLDSILTRPHVSWQRAALPPTLRSRVHFIAALVPPFPHDDPRLMEPRNWPAAMTIEGSVCSLAVYVNDGRYSTWSRSVEDSSTAVVLELCYADPGVDFHSLDIRHRGPFYDWLSGRLRQRSWTTVRGSHSRVRAYWPYPSGELFAFMEFEKKYDAQGNEVSVKWIEEVFARDGTLIGCCVGPVNDWGACGGYWMGVDVGKDYQYRWAEALERSLERP